MNLYLHPTKVIPAPDSGFTLGAGRLFNQQDKEAIGHILNGQQSALSFIPSTVLARDSSGYNMVWFTPPKRAEVHFREATYSVPLPLLIYAKFEGQPLRVFAAKGKNRPTLDTRLWIAPLGNINTNGSMCMGNVQLPEFNGSESDKLAYECFAIEARATHFGNTPPVQGVNSFDEYQSFMGQLHEQKAKTFPNTKLKPVLDQANQAATLNQLIQSGAQA